MRSSDSRRLSMSRKAANRVSAICVVVLWLMASLQAGLSAGPDSFSMIVRGLTFWVFSGLAFMVGYQVGKSDGDRLHRKP